MHTETKNAALRGIVSSYLSALVKLLKVDSFQTQVLQDSLLVALSVLMPAIVSSKKFPEFHYDSIWNLASFSKKQSMIPSCTPLHLLKISTILILLTATFAQYLLASDQLCDPLICHESWDFFRDMLIAIINRDLKEEEEQLALLISPILCRAMRKLITSSQVSTREFFCHD